MKRRLFVTIGLCLGIGLALSVATRAEAQDKAKDKAAPKQERVQGTVQQLDQKAMLVTVRVTGKTTPTLVVYSDKTEITFRNKPSTLQELQIGRRIICLGARDDKSRWVATRIDIREK